MLVIVLDTIIAFTAFVVFIFTLVLIEKDDGF